VIIFIIDFLYYKIKKILVIESSFSAEKKGYSGVAILTRITPDHLEYGMGMQEYDREGRFLRADYGDLSIVSVYHPSGTTGEERQSL